MYGDVAISWDGGTVIDGLDTGEFHTYRYETLDGENYTFSVDGLVFDVDFDDQHHDGGNYIQLGGLGAGGMVPTPNIKNEWDYVRFGTIDYGEQIVSTDPPQGYLDPNEYFTLTRFTITFNSPNFIHLDDISVGVTGGTAPEILRIRRRDNDPPETIEIVLDRGMPLGETTTFFIDDGGGLRTIEYTLDDPPPAIPTVSTWGIIVLTLLITTAGTIPCPRWTQVCHWRLARQC
ncbi:MAG: hypothetical protein JSU63_11840 [Phycisphaerales bacterium]|nr:MAG: hypothetical protein JSU63_11840 [Phycisphaerales bacterium]